MASISLLPMKNACVRTLLKHVFLLVMSLGSVFAVGAYGRNESEAVIQFDIPAQPLDAALLNVSAQANVDVLVSSTLVTPYKSPVIKGEMTLSKALDQLLQGTALTYKISKQQRVTISAIKKPQPKTLSETPKAVKAIEEVIVTATKRATDLQKTPIAVTALNQANLNQYQAKDIRNLTDVVPGLEMTNTGEQSALLVQLRGIGQTNITEIADGPVALHIDGVYSPRAQGAATLLYDLDRIEVLRGPQGTLFGRNATAGGINIQTEKPKLESVSAELAVTLGNYEHEALKATVNIPVTETWALRFAGALDKHDAYTKLINNYAGLGPQYPATEAELNTYQKAATNAQGPDADDQRALRLSSYWEPTENFHWFASLEHYLDQGTSVTELDPTLVARGMRVTVSDTPSFIDLTNNTFRSRMDYTFANEQTLSYIAGTAVMRREQGFDQDMGRSGNYEQRRTDNSTFRFRSHELQLINSDKEHLRWIVGAFASQERNDIVYAIDQADDDGHGDPTKTTSFISDFGGAATAIFVQPDRRVESKAAFAQITYDVNERNRFTAGVRHTRDTKSDEGGRSLNCRVTGMGPYLTNDSIGHGAPKPHQIYADAGAQAAIAAGLPYDDGTHVGIGDQVCWTRQVNDYSATWKNTSGLLRYEYDVHADVMSYASVATGFKSGHIQDRGNEAKPEEVINYELGLKSTLLDGNLRLNAALYQADYTNLQFSDRDLFDTNGDGVVDRVTSTVVRNAAAATVKGLEVEIDWAITGNDYVHFASALMNARFDNFQTPDTLFGNLFNPYVDSASGRAAKIVELSGNAPVRAPDWKFTLVYKHDFELSSGVVSAQTKATFSDEYFLDIYNRTNLAAEIFKSAPNGAKDLAVQKAYRSYDISLRYESNNNWALEGFIKNVTDQNIKTSSGTFITPGGFDAIFLPPRTFGVTLSYQFK
ncbi:TonB-dependent receptor domain-containing protein [Cellvibrio zantedeschiae]|nr:TonB-dependent receptor [Cellvibrio zantedeschiae]